jgi:hypothetical protein
VASGKKKLITELASGFRLAGLLAARIRRLSKLLIYFILPVV